MFSVEVKPTFQKVGKGFSNISKRLPGALQKSLESFAYTVEGESKRVSPVDTGTMRRSIGTTMGNLQATIKPNVYYAGFVHWGTYKMRARPFMEWGVKKAVSKFGGKLPFTVTTEKVISEELGNL